MYLLAPTLAMKFKNCLETIASKGDGCHSSASLCYLVHNVSNTHTRNHRLR